MLAPVLGIDFGTTKTLVSYCDPATGRPRPILLGRGAYYLPTTVYAAEGGEFLFGDAADDEMELDASRYCRGFKMELGSDFPVLGFDEGNEFREFTARELTCKFLRYVRQTCEQRVFLGQSVQRAVITCPVSFSRAQRADLQNAAEQAGFREVQLLSEPEAAGLAFCHLCPEGAFNGEALIVDWGGGTLDMALVTLNGNEIAIHSSYTDGRTNMGGELFDDHIWQYVARQLRAQHGVDLDQEAPEVQGRIRTRLRQEKERLSLQERHKLRLASSTGALPPVELTRAAFESLIAGEVDQAVRMAVMLCDSIRESVLKPEILLLVGGTSLIPCIAESLKQQVGVPCYPWEYVREAVSLGAAIKGNEAAAPPRKVLIEHTLQLTPQEMASGCLKVIPIQNKKLEVRIHAGVKDGTKLRLSGERTQGLGVVMLLLRTPLPTASGARTRWSANQKLIDAVQSNNLCVADTALKHGADIEHKSPSGWTALQIAVQNRHSDMVKCLLAAGANPNVLYGDGYSLLMQAASRNNVRIIHALLSHRALINHQDSRGMTALMYAASADSLSSVSALLQYARIKANLRNKQGETALDIAHKKGNEKVVEILNQYAAGEKNSNVKGKLASPSGGATGSSKSAVVHANVHWSYMMDKVP